MEIITLIMRTLIVIIIAVLVALVIKQRKQYQKKDNKIEEHNEEVYNENEQYEKYYPYHKKYLLTKNEYYFYKKLKEVADRNNLQILAKIRLADLIEVDKGLQSGEWSRYFSKIKSKHIDFALADNMKIVLIIELDDSSHNQENRQARDEFVDGALTQCGYSIVHTYGNTEQIESALQEIYKNILK